LRAPRLFAEPRVESERARGAIDVELGVAARVAAVRHREIEQRITVLVNDPTHRQEELAALAEGEGA
jgi:hypothetical protein